MVINWNELDLDKSAYDEVLNEDEKNALLAGVNSKYELGEI